MPENKAARRLPAWATRNRLMMAGGAMVVAGAFFNWGWLTAIGVAPILLADMSMMGKGPDPMMGAPGAPAPKG